MENDRVDQKLLDTLGDGCARQVLAEIARRPASVVELTDRMELSRATIYRRVETLHEHGLIEERTLVGDGGNHYSEYRSDFGGTVVSLEDDGYEVRVVQNDDVLEQFEQE